MSAPPNFVKIFGEQLTAFFDDILLLFPDNVDLISAKNTLFTLKKLNPKRLVLLWKKYVAIPYGATIDLPDLEQKMDFFLNKDYSTDLNAASAAGDEVKDKGKIMETIEKMRAPIREMSPDSQQKTFKYLSNLCRVSQMVN